MQDNLALAIKNLVLDKGINIPASNPKSNVQDLKKPDLFSLTKETELFQNEKGITIKIDRSKDSKLTNFGKATLDDRYLAEGESYQDLFARVAANYSDNNCMHKEFTTTLVIFGLCQRHQFYQTRELIEVCRYLAS
jgi:ribonucleoside-diphosphate reductase alpha chain